MNDKLKAVAEAAYRLAKAQAKRDVIQRSLDGIIAEQERRAAVKAAAMNPDKNLEIPPTQMINSDMDDKPVDELIDDDDNYASHLGNAILAIINDARLSRDEKRQKVLGALKLLDEHDEDEDIEKMLGNAILEIINDAALSTANKRRKILGALKLT